MFPDDFKWLARIKVALEFAFLVECLHGEELLLRNTDAAHLIVDEVSLGAYFYLFWTLLRMVVQARILSCVQAFSPRLLDFSLLVGGVFGGIPSRECEWGCVGYADPRLLKSGNWSDKTDIFAYGIVRLGLIAKRRVYDTSSDSRQEMNDGDDPKQQPTMKQVVCCLRELNAVRFYGHIIGNLVRCLKVLGDGDAVIYN
ncbi:hypothetical protein RHMOL_Rhmol01G0108100 [Rhododendron molle]|uniref:Uncharacterized protein n=1 Tax=Rhododendron molle TaxID=49168 RepID=A0ACC0PZU8_RHOML|nr:hypothetical protein RHMOL_Rhmol01G0108100 [Rhododendron molle]